jgi:hypothetical protein
MFDFFTVQRATQSVSFDMSMIKKLTLKILDFWINLRFYQIKTLEFEVLSNEEIVFEFQIVLIDHR